MSIATQIARLQGLRNRLRTKILGLGLDTDPALDLDDCVGIIEGISGTQDITTAGSVYNVAGKQYARVNDRELKPENIVRGKTILGVTGTAAVNPPSANIQGSVTMLYGGVNPPATVYPSSGYDGIAQVVPELTDASPALVPGNIKNGATIMGVTGNYQTPTETKSPALAELKEAGITSHSVNIVPSSNKHLSQVTIPQITAAIDSNIVSGNIKAGVSILGVTGTAVVACSPLCINANTTSSEITRELRFLLPNEIQAIPQIIYMSVSVATLLGVVEFGPSNDFNNIIANFEYLGNSFDQDAGRIRAIVVYDDSGLADSTAFIWRWLEYSGNPLWNMSIVTVGSSRFLKIELVSTSLFKFAGCADNGTVQYMATILYSEI